MAERFGLGGRRFFSVRLPSLFRFSVVDTNRPENRKENLMEHPSFFGAIRVKNLLKFLLHVLVVAGVSTAAEANLIRLHFSTTVTDWTGHHPPPNDPFGITAVAGVTHVQGSVLYDPSATPIAFVTNEASFLFSIPNGFRMQI